ncbi:GNAT family N-acetyltransferase [Anaerocolumna sedimenticola]|uniref:GNAT family N-acetyltransferase n=1 Tax=Anaerocolumna sedimenticola TaxID=2696063 RepID=A0A6P1TM41_9FIRM|nr:GNAT family N-acetyltransferase [Anaerocolumna sedimenticola]QHQ61212.1 GNAT family N-acetyltransferase [Anaerocolumna sedimenticola]
MKEIETQRLRLRSFRPEDWKDLHEYLSDEDVVKFEPYETYTEEESRQEAINRSGNDAFWAVILKENNKLIGNIYFEKQEFETWEIGYVFHTAYQKFGYATESARAIMDYAFYNLNARRIVARCDTKNTASWKLLERLHMRREGHYRKLRYFKMDKENLPIWIDAYEYAILSEEWNQN